MAETTNYRLPKPVGTDYYDIEVFNAAMDAIDGQMKTNAEAAGAAGSAAAAAQGTADGATAAAAAAQSTADGAAAGVEALEAVNAPLTTGGTAQAFTLTPDPAISAYADGQTWTVRFHADGDSTTLNVSSLGAAAILEATGKAAKVKAGQIARVMRLGDSFFTVSGGGGVSLPDIILEGDTPVHADVAQKVLAYNNGYYYAIAGCTITCIKAGAYRFKYYGSNSGGYSNFKLVKNSVDVSDSSLHIDSYTRGSKIITVSLVAGDVVQLQCYGGTNSLLTGFVVSILADDLQSELNKTITVA